MEKLGITTDCVCDLPEEYFELHDVGVLYFYITTGTGRFRDGYELDSANVIEYLENGGEKAQTNPPKPTEYMDFFQSQLKKHEEIIHICISSNVSESYKNALEALTLMGEDGKRVHIVDSQHLSTGMGHLVVNAVEMCNSGKSAEEILEQAESIKKRISTSFIADNADYLYRNGRVSKCVMKICSVLMLHPVLYLKDGKISLKTLKTGNYGKAVKRYIKGELGHNGKINKHRLFITHAGCTVKMISEIKEEVNKLCEFDEVIVTKASATISGNCGAGTIGVLFVNND